MENLKSQRFTGKKVKNDEIVKGTLNVIDFEKNVGGYSLAINDGKENHIVEPDSIELVLRPHPDYEFCDEDEVFIENSDGSTDYFLLIYSVETCEWVLIPHEDKHFKEPKKNKNGRTKAETLQSFGYDVIERVADYDFNELP